MKKAILLLVFCMLLSAAGCGKPGEAPTTALPETTFAVDGYALQITADSSFREDTGGSFDLQITNDKSYVSIMAYNYADLPEGTTARDVFDVQNNELLSKRDAVEEVEAPTTQSLPHCQVIRALYTAERDGSKNYYESYLLDFPESQILAWVLVTATTTYMPGHRDYLSNIVFSLTPTR